MSDLIKILICTHKEVELPGHEYFFPVQAGTEIAQVSLPYAHDNTGDHISGKNRNYCELTAHYWAWKNLRRTEIIGLNHYRRYFDFYRPARRFSPDRLFVNAREFLNTPYQFPDLPSLLQKYDIVLPVKRTYPFNLVIQYAEAHIIDDWKILKEVIGELSPEYIPAFQKTMEQSNALSHYNMFITVWSRFQEYSEWLFRILFEVEKRIKISAYPVQARVFGYMSERLMNVYCEYHKLNVAYYPVIMPLEDYQGGANPGNLRYMLRKTKYNLSYLLNKPR